VDQQYPMGFVLVYFVASKLQYFLIDTHHLPRQKTSPQSLTAPRVDAAFEVVAGEEQQEEDWTMESGEDEQASTTKSSVLFSLWTTLNSPQQILKIGIVCSGHLTVPCHHWQNIPTNS
jgi:hypothetical protein